MPLQIGVDVGGTFTDIFGIDAATGTTRVFKIASTPDDPSEAILAGVRGLLAQDGASGSDVIQLSHGTTVGTNALLERRGPSVALLTTAGFRDLLEIGRQTRPDNYDMHSDFPPPVVPRWRRYEVPERMRADGSVHVELTDAAIAAAVRAVGESGAKAVAVCFLFSYLAPEHEQRIKAALAAALPEVAISISSEVQPEFREYERFSTTAANAYLQPVMEGYLANLATRAGMELPEAEVLISQSSGGLMALDAARRFPIRTALSGPAAGVAGALEVARAADRPNVITFDMGGTSADVAMIRGLETGESFACRIGGLPIRMPMLDIHTVGAGGGSIAWIDRDDLLKVGPQSAGARPGPACYGYGGVQATVTDANVVLGRLPDKGLVGGTMSLDRHLAVRAISALAGRLGLSVERTARGILSIVVSNMVRAIRVISVERGYDPRDFSLLAFGGAGPLHSREVAASLGMREIIIPLNPGILCAAGLITADIKESFVRTVRLPLDDRSHEVLGATLAELAEGADRWFESGAIPPAERAISGSMELRYVGQNFELAIALPPDPRSGRLALPTLTRLREQFFAAHERNYGYFNAEDEIEAVNLRVAAQRKRVVVVERSALAVASAAPAPVAIRPAILDGESAVPTAIYDRSTLRPGYSITGPAIIEQMDTTTVLFAGDVLRVDAAGNLLITLEG